MDSTRKLYVRMRQLGRFRPCRWLAGLAVIPSLLTLGGAAKAAPDDPALSAEPTKPLTPKAEPIPVTTGGEALAKRPAAPFIEQMGPETFPGRLRGLRGGSLWLEPSFHGLQWPQMAQTGIGISGSFFWSDSGYETIKRDLQKLPNSSMYFQQGRGLLRVTPTYVRGRFFVQGQAELVGSLCQTASEATTVCNAGAFTTDDLWIRVGEWNRWDLKVGRFEGWEVYHLGMGMDPYTLERKGAGMFGTDNPDTPIASPMLEAPSLYAVNSLHDRPTDGLAMGYAALHAYPTEYLRFELLAKMGTDNDQKEWKSTGGGSSTGVVGSTYLGGRPTVIFDIGWFKLKIGGEYQKRRPVMQDVMFDKKDPVEVRINKGVGASVQFVIDPTIEFGLNAAIGSQSMTDNLAKDVPENSYTTKSVGGFANLRLADLWLLGIGVNRTSQTDAYVASSSTSNDYTSHWQGFASLQYLLAGQLFIKAEVGYARAHFQPSDISTPEWSNFMYSSRIRLMYLY
jgi:hypothetical protein